MNGVYTNWNLAIVDRWFTLKRRKEGGGEEEAANFTCLHTMMST